jgi:hypothetical protein
MVDMNRFRSRRLLNQLRPDSNRGGAILELGDA